MAASEIVLRVLVSSPSDVADERVIVDEVVRELNLAWSQTLQRRLDVLKWETHTFPSFGSDVQEVVNEQLGDEYDIFIGLMWTRFGTPTPRYGSGTEEEFRRALKRLRRGDAIQVMLYFKNAAVSPSDVEPTQLARVHQFRSSLGSEGGYYWTFNTSDQLAGFLRLHLARVLQRAIQANPNAVIERPCETQASQSETADSEDLGIIEHFEAVELGLARATTSMSAIIAAMVQSGAALNERSAEMNELTARGNINLLDVKRFADRTSEDFDVFVKRVDVEGPLLGQNYGEAMEHLTAVARLLSSATAGGVNILGPLRAQLHTALAALGEYAAQIDSTYGTLASFPRVNVKLNRAKRRTLEAIDRIRQSARFAEQATRDALKLLGDEPVEV